MAARSARKVVAGAVSGLFGVAANNPAPDSWRRDRQDNSDSDPISGKEKKTDNTRFTQWKSTEAN